MAHTESKKYNVLSNFLLSTTAAVVLSACSGGGADNPSEAPEQGAANGGNVLEEIIDTNGGDKPIDVLKPIDKGELEGPVGDFGPYLDFVAEVYDGYEGKTDLAVLDEESSPQFLNAALFGQLNSVESTSDTRSNLTQSLVFRAIKKTAGKYEYHVVPLYSIAHADSADPRPCIVAPDSTIGSISWEPSQTISSGDKTLSEVTLTYDNCHMGDFTVDGIVHMATDSFDAASDNPARYFKYDNVKVTLPSSEILIVTGVDSLSHGTACNAARPMRSYLNVNNETLQQNWLYENVLISLFEGDEGTYCTRITDEEARGTVPSGRIALADAGVVIIPKTNSDDHTADHLDIQGAGGHQIRYANTKIPVPTTISSDDFDVKSDGILTSTVTLENGDDVLFTFTHARYATRLGSFNSFADSDGDTLLDSWEIAYRLDPLDASDATEDYDRDSLNALEEFALSTNPSHDKSNGWLSDNEITLSAGARSDNADNTTEYKVSVFIPPSETVVSAKRFNYAIGLTDGATFVSANADEPDVNTFIPGSSWGSIGGTSCTLNSSATELNCTSLADEKCDLLIHGTTNLTKRRNNYTLC